MQSREQHSTIFQVLKEKHQSPIMLCQAKLSFKKKKESRAFLDKIEVICHKYTYFERNVQKSEKNVNDEGGKLEKE